MSLVRTEITLKNAVDVGNADRGYITEGQVRTLTVESMVDTGAWTLVINEEVCKKLGLRLTGPEPGVLADGSNVVCQMTDGVEVHWKDRQTVCPAIVVPGADEVLLGALALGTYWNFFPNTSLPPNPCGSTALSSKRRKARLSKRT